MSAGEIAFAGGQGPGAPFSPSNLFVIRPDGSALRRLTNDDWRRFDLAWSPDGSTLAYVRSGGEFPPSNIYVSGADGRHTRALTSQTTQYENSPAWSPDGRTIAFARGGDNVPYELYLMDSNGTDVRQLTHGGGNDLDPSWSPDGTRIVFTATPTSSSGLTHVFEIDADGSHVHRLTRQSLWELSPRWSPDGSVIAFVLRGEDDRPPDRLVLVRPDGSGTRVIYECANGCEIESLGWSPDATRIVMTIVGRGSSRGMRWTSRLFVIGRDGAGLREIETGSLNACCASWAPR